MFHWKWIMQHLVFCALLISLSGMSPVLTHVIAHIRTPCLFTVEWYSLVRLCHALFSHSFVGGHFGCFSLSTTENSAAVSIGVQMSVWVPAFKAAVYVPKSGVAGSCSNSMCSFLRNQQTVFHSGCTLLHSHQQRMRVQFPHILMNTYCFIDSSHFK